jgi:hypothetical protein
VIHTISVGVVGDQGERIRPRAPAGIRRLWVALCRWCHDQTDAPYGRGRLVVTALGAGQFRFDVIRRVARGSVPVDEHEVCPRGQNDPALIGTPSVIPSASLHLNVSDIHDVHAD